MADADLTAHPALKEFDAADYLTDRESIEAYLSDAVPTSESLEEIAAHLRNALRALDRLGF